jgi:hypothetical protein
VSVPSGCVSACRGGGPNCNPNNLRGVSPDTLRRLCPVKLKPATTVSILEAVREAGPPNKLRVRVSTVALRELHENSSVPRTSTGSPAVEAAITARFEHTTDVGSRVGANTPGIAALLGGRTGADANIKDGGTSTTRTDGETTRRVQCKTGRRRAEYGSRSVAPSRARHISGSPDPDTFSQRGRSLRGCDRPEAVRLISRPCLRNRRSHADRQSASIHDSCRAP